MLRVCGNHGIEVPSAERIQQVTAHFPIPINAEPDPDYIMRGIEMAIEKAKAEFLFNGQHLFKTFVSSYGTIHHCFVDYSYFPDPKKAVLIVKNDAAIVQVNELPNWQPTYVVRFENGAQADARLKYRISDRGDYFNVVIDLFDMKTTFIDNIPHYSAIINDNEAHFKSFETVYEGKNCTPLD